MHVTLTLNVNGVDRTVTTDPERKLLDVLREDLHLTGTKYGCGEGRCGACIVLLDGKRALSCRIPVSTVAKRRILTIEGLERGGVLHPVQQAFIDEGAMQCGYCTPGMILCAIALLREKPNSTDAEIIAGMNGNVCRCNGYVKIINAVRRAAKAGR